MEWQYLTAELFLLEIKAQLLKRCFPNSGGQVVPNVLGDMLNPYYCGAGLEVLSHKFDMYNVLAFKHEVH